MRQTTILICGMLLAGCGGRPGGISDAMSYDVKSLAHVKMDDDTYRVFEHPQGDRLMTTPSLGAAAGQGFVQAATFGLANIETPEQRHEAAARRYLDITGRAACTIVSGYELVRTQFEFKISCPEGTVRTGAPTVAEQVAAGATMPG